MSTGAECNFWEAEPGRWKYRLQHYPFGETDEFDEYGPFRSYALARKHLDDNHANPGGWSTRCLPEGEHVHEWTTGRKQGKVGLTVRISVNSLGPDPDRLDAIRFIQSLPPEHPAFETFSNYGTLAAPITSCEACGKEKDG